MLLRIPPAPPQAAGSQEPSEPAEYEELEAAIFELEHQRDRILNQMALQQGDDHVEERAMDDVQQLVRSASPRGRERGQRLLRQGSFSREDTASLEETEDALVQVAPNPLHVDLRRCLLAMPLLRAYAGLDSRARPSWNRRHKTIRYSR